jgi:serine/threonine-protein kinase
MMDFHLKHSMMHGGGAIAILAVAVGAGAARAQEASGADLAAAEALFEEGKKLSDAGSFADSCARFEASMSLVPRLGVQLNLADCYERVGKTASAWVAFGQAAALARRISDARETFALERQQALAPRLSRLRLSITHAGVEGFSLTRDGMRIPPSVYDVEVPVDPGLHQIEAAAPGRLPWSTQVAVSEEGNVVTVVIPELERTPRPPPAPPAAPPVAPTTRDAGKDRPGVTRPVWITAGVGGVGIGVGATLGLVARSLRQEASRDCDSSGNCTDAAYALIQRSHRNGNLSTCAFAIGGVALGASIVLYLRGARDRGRSSVHLVPAMTSSAVGAAIGGAF